MRLYGYTGGWFAAKHCQCRITRKQWHITHGLRINSCPVLEQLRSFILGDRTTLKLDSPEIRDSAQAYLIKERKMKVFTYLLGSFWLDTHLYRCDRIDGVMCILSRTFIEWTGQHTKIKNGISLFIFLCTASEHMVLCYHAFWCTKTQVY